MLKNLKEQVWQANLDLVKFNLVILTFGNVSGFDRRRGLLAIKPSGVSYEDLRPIDILVVDLDGKVVEGKLNPSSDTPTHIELYKAFPEIGGISHAHSVYATAFAQAVKEIPCFGTTHADQFNGPVPVTRFLTRKEVRADYEGNTGKVIIERFAGIKPLEMPAVLVAGHGPFSWGRTPEEAVQNNLVLENVAKMALLTRLANPKITDLPGYILNKHYQRKHGPQAYYGQKTRSHHK
ncbi:MAG: L-ribulose-5-phosphate 4-epimerase [Candidatus Aminicenantes bacterium]|nr:L-ribulose-5-phosphate 4-epimerase [Candidatus Aminicenantes bacterium]